jgi:hypothetical protein
VASPRSPETDPTAGGESAHGGKTAGRAGGNPEFRPYRRFVALVALTIITVGSGYLLVSVGVSI